MINFQDKTHSGLQLLGQESSEEIVLRGCDPDLQPTFYSCLQQVRSSSIKSNWLQIIPSYAL